MGAPCWVKVVGASQSEQSLTEGNIRRRSCAQCNNKVSATEAAMKVLSYLLNLLLTPAALAAGMWGPTAAVKPSNRSRRSDEWGRLTPPSGGTAFHQPIPASAGNRSVARPRLTAAGSWAGPDASGQYDSQSFEVPEAPGGALAVLHVLAPTIPKCASLTRNHVQPRSAS
jgi:hypothetical protein